MKTDFELGYQLTVSVIHLRGLEYVRVFARRHPIIRKVGRVSVAAISRVTRPGSDPDRFGFQRHFRRTLEKQFRHDKRATLRSGLRFQAGNRDFFPGFYI